MASRVGRAVSRTVPGALELVEITKPEETARTVVVRITARPIYPFDLLAINKSVVFDEGEFVPGCEGFGIVEEVGKSVTSVKKGDRVVPLLLWDNFLGQRQGSWQDTVTVSYKNVISVPSEISDEDAAQMIINPWTAYGLLKDINASAGSYILQNDAGSVLGRTVIQLAKHWGIKTINLVRDDNVKKELQAMGADTVLNAAKEDVAAAVKDLTNGAGVEAAIDALSGFQTVTAAACVKSGGNVFTIASMESPDTVLPLRDPWRKVTQSFWSLVALPGEKREIMADEIVELIKAKIIGPFPVAAKFPLEDFRAAMEQSEKTQGIVLLVE